MSSARERIVEAEPALSVELRRKWLWIAALAAFIGLINTSIEVTDHLAVGEDPELVGVLVREMTGAFSVLLLLPGLLWFFRRHPLKWGSILRVLPLYLAANLIFAVLHTLLMTLSREALYPFLDLGTYDPGLLFYRFLMESHKQLLIFWFVFAVVRFFQHYESQRRRRLRTAELERQLSRARLDLLRLQLNPHFLFNTLNLISSCMYEDVQKADRMLANLSELLRASLSLSQVQEVPLGKELELLDLFLEIMKARFEDRLSVERDIEPPALKALFPSLLLQPLVENSIKYGLEGGRRSLEISISARTTGGKLSVALTDNGPGIDSQEGKEKSGIGLSATRERVSELYGEEAGFEIRNRPQGGVRVEVVLPLRYR